MALKVNTNITALEIQNNITNINDKVSSSLQRLSSGLRINSAKDDAAGFAVANSFKAKIAAMTVASQNASEAQSMLQTADGAYNKIHDILIRMKSLATEASSGQIDDANRTTMNNEFSALQNEIDRIAGSTKYGSTTLVDSTKATVTFQVTASNIATDQIAVKFSDASSNGLLVKTAKIDSAAHAQTAMDSIDTALTSINSYMGDLGAYQNRFQYTIENLSTSIENYSASESTIRDVDMASEISNFTKNQILQQSGMAMLAQANQAPQQVLSLLR